MNLPPNLRQLMPSAVILTLLIGILMFLAEGCTTLQRSWDWLNEDPCYEVTCFGETKAIQAIFEESCGIPVGHAHWLYEDHKGEMQEHTQVWTGELDFWHLKYTTDGWRLCPAPPDMNPEKATFHWKKD